MKPRKRRISTKTLAFVSCFAALYAILRVLPTFPMLGVSGASFAAGDIVAPLYGIILGPVIGPFSIIIGTALGHFGRPPVFLGLDFLPATMNALVLGLLMRRKWAASVAIYSVLLVVFIVHPLSLKIVSVGGVQMPFHWMHFIAFIVLISPLGQRSADWLTKPSVARLAWGVAVMAFIGTFVQHSTGSLLWETVHGTVLGVLTPDAFMKIWAAIFWVYPIERVFLIVVATIIGVPAVSGLNSAGLLLAASPTIATTKK